MYKRQRLIFTAHDDEGVKEAKNPLRDDEEEKDEGLPGAVSLDQKLLVESARLAELMAPYAVAENKVSECGDAARGAPDRRRFVGICVSVQAIFLQDHLPSWPWRPGAQEEMEPIARAEKARLSAEAFRKWMELMSLA